MTSELTWVIQDIFSGSSVNIEIPKNTVIFSGLTWGGLGGAYIGDSNGVENRGPSSAASDGIFRVTDNNFYFTFRD